MTRGEILDRAAECVLRDRAAEHGDVEDNFALIAALWAAYLRMPVRTVDVANMMTLLKIARSRNNPGYVDNWVDQAGYAACGGELGTGGG